MQSLRNLKSNSRIFNLALPLLVWPLLFLSSCAFDFHNIKQVPTEIESTVTAKDSFVLIDEVTLIISPGYFRILNAGTRWSYKLTITQGDVFKTNDQILTVEAANIFEAYIVVSSKQIVGFYLPVQKTFSPLKEAQELNMRE